MIKMTHLLNEISDLPQKPLNPLHAWMQKVSGKMEAPYEDPKVAYAAARRSVTGIVKLSKIMLMAALRKRPEVYKQARNTLENGRRAFGNLYMDWTLKMDEKNPEGNYQQKFSDSLNTIDEAHAMLLQACEKISQEEPDIIGAKKDIEIMNELFAKIATQVDEIFGEWGSGKDYPTDIRSIKQ